MARRLRGAAEAAARGEWRIGAAGGGAGGSSRDADAMDRAAQRLVVGWLGGGAVSATTAWLK